MMRLMLSILVALSPAAFSAGEEPAVPLKPFKTRTESPAPARNTHVVAAGETVYSIARKHGRDPKLLLWLNRIEETEPLPVGKVLFIGDGPSRPAGE